MAGLNGILVKTRRSACAPTPQPQRDTLRPHHGRGPRDLHRRRVGGNHSGFPLPRTREARRVSATYASRLQCLPRVACRVLFVMYFAARIGVVLKVLHSSETNFADFSINYLPTLQPQSYHTGDVERPVRRPRPYVDVVSISSVARPEVVQAQRSTWASHRTVRNFIVVTEKDDPDPYCHVNLTDDMALDYTRQCKRRKTAWPSNNFLTNHFTTQFARPQWLSKKQSPSGWICAQRRMAMGLAMLRKKYEAEPVPDYVILGDDDMYLNMNRFERDILTNPSTVGEIQEEGADQSAKVYAGCLVLAAPAQLIQFMFPFGGWGTFFSKGAIERLITPLNCSKRASSDERPSFEEGACRRLVGGDDLLSESRYFEDGMSLSDLMGAFASSTTPYCVHSDWAIGYFINFYNVSTVRWNGPEADIGWYPDSPQTRMHPLGGQDSFIYKNSGGNCRMSGEKCNGESFVCHYVGKLQMEQTHAMVMAATNASGLQLNLQ